MTSGSSAQAYGEDPLVEQPTIELFAALGWETANLHHEWASGASSEGRRSTKEVFLAPRLRAALRRLNPDLPETAFDQAVGELTRDRSLQVPVNANAEVYRLLKEGLKVRVPDEAGGSTTATVRFIDWRNPAANDFLLASQVWIRGEVYRRRADLVGFVNGIPLLFLELKAPGVALKNAYDDNLTDYRHAIPHVFVPNGFVVLSNGSDTRIGSTYAAWEHFAEWKRINDEGEAGVVSLETVIRGSCTQARLLDLVENFVVFEETRTGLVKKLARNHQYLGVNNAIGALAEIKERPEGAAGKLGVFWHTQGSGKSLSMVFLTQKILRTVPGNWTFVMVTDRDELDDQIFKTFANTGAITGAEAQATSGDHLKQLLREDHRYVFTLIQKFQTRDGSPYPKLSDRRDIIVITDEAHRSQYDTLAMNMRRALPNAAFLGFTGTPLMAGEELTKEVFGSYVSVYDFGQSIKDGATVPLYYENRIPELQLTNEALGDELDALLEEAELDEDQERKVAREFGREYHLITRDERLEAIAEDLVKHFVGRGHRGKAMMVCIDKPTAVKMYDKVQAQWTLHLDRLRAALTAASETERAIVEAQIAFMETTDMAVVVSQSQNEVRDLAERGVDITPHRKRMNTEALDEKFKDAKDPLRLVFVCAMWITGFDVPSCSTMYLDKPMKNHTLMQTIARANRTDPGKEAGLIVDYVGVFRNLQRALAIYGGSAALGGAPPIQDKSELVEYLRQLVAEVMAFCDGLGVDLEAIKSAEGFERVARMDAAVEEIVRDDETKRGFLGRARAVSRVYKAILPDPAASEFSPTVVLVSVLAQKIKALTPAPDISGVMQQVEDLLDRSVAPVPYQFPEEPDLIDISGIDFEGLRRKFAEGKKRTEAEKLRALLNQKLTLMVEQNGTRADLAEKFEELIERYNAGSLNIEQFFEELLRFTEQLREEEARAVREGLSEEELALFDILTKPAVDLTEKAREQVKRASRDLLAKLKREKLVLDWTRKPNATAEVRSTIEVMLDRELPEAYDETLFNEKCELAFQHVFAKYSTDVAGKPETGATQ